LAVLQFNTTFKNTASDAFLTPYVSRVKQTIGVKACHFGAGASATWRAVITLTGAEHEVAAVSGRVSRFRKEFDVIYVAVVFASDASTLQSLADAPSKAGEFFEIAEGYLNWAFALSEIKPVAAPGNVAGDSAMALDFDGDIFSVAISRDVAHRDKSAAMRLRTNVSDRRFDSDAARLELTEVGEGGDQADGAVAAHADKSNVVKEDNAELVGRVRRLTEECADDGVITARFIDDGGAKLVVMFAKDGKAFAHGTGAEVGCAGKHEPGRFTAGMRIDYLNAHEGIGL